MQNNVQPDFQSQLDAIFARLNPQAVEEFYAAYHQWCLQQQVSELRQRIEAIRAQQAENEQRLREAQPSAIALAALARLQSNGVSDIALLDAMLERGESWLDQTMQRLDYFEQFEDFISDDYTKWCQSALEGAFDWIDSLREDTEQAAPAQGETPSEGVPSNSEDAEDAGEVEALLLQRLATDHEEDDLAWQEATTLKRPAIQPPEEQIVPEEPSPVEESAIAASEPDQPALIGFAPSEEIAPGEDEPHAADDQPPLIESAPVDELPAAGDEPYAGNEEPTFVEFAAPSPSGVSPPEETSDREAEQAEPPAVPAPEDVSTGEDTAQRESGQPQEMEYSAPQEAAPYETQATSPGQAVRPAQSNPRKGGFLRLLIRLLAGV